MREAGVAFRWLRGAEIERAHWEFFERCYRRTYAEHRSSPYLNLEFFLRLGEVLTEKMLLVIAERNGKPIASSLLVVANGRILGRYWGALEHVPLLHFECCYYQAIEYAIAHRLARELKPHLVVMGTHGRTGLARNFLGSVAETAVRRLPVPVLCLKSLPDRPAPSLNVRRIGSF